MGSSAAWELRTTITAHVCIYTTPIYTNNIVFYIFIYLHIIVYIYIYIYICYTPHLTDNLDEAWASAKLSVMSGASDTSGSEKKTQATMPPRRGP